VLIEDIARAEASLDGTFPNIYKGHMLRRNGGEVEIDDEVWWLFPIRDESDPKRLRRTAVDVVVETRNVRSANIGFPFDCVAIGHNGAGDYLMMRRNGTQFSEHVEVFRLRNAEAESVGDIGDLLRNA
jgi:SMI1-KNR4 cell-wall